MKKNVYFVQVSAVYGNTAYLPYASGCLAACAWKNEVVKANYELKRFLYVKEDVDTAVASLEKPYLEKYGGVTAEGLAESAMGKVKLIEDMGFDDIVISIKSSDVMMCVKAHELLAGKTPTSLF